MKESKNRERSAFTLTELLAINAMAVALTATMLPSFNQANGGTRQAYCAANKRQLGLAWLMYAADNRGVLVQNQANGSSYNAKPALTSWANGWEGFTINNSDNTNVMNLIGTGSPLNGTQFGPYVKDVRIYKCPCDVYLCLESVGHTLSQLPRVRSVSMSAFVGTPDGAFEPPSGWGKVYHKTSDIISPPPAMLWVISDEHPDSINDAWLLNEPPASPGPYSWIDLPGSYHHGGNVMVFADGHAEYHQWVDGYNPSTGSGTVQPVRQNQLYWFSDPKGFDAFWWGVRTTVALP